MKHSFRHAATAALVVSLLAAIGCSDGRTRPPRVDVVGVHAASRTGNIFFYRENQNLIGDQAPFSFRTTRSWVFDSDQYRFSADAGGVVNSPVVPLASFEATLQPDHAYVLILAQRADDTVEPLIVERPAFRDGAGTQVTFTHASPASAPLSVYLESPGTSPTAAAPVATLAYGESLPAHVMPQGEYQLTLTEANNPANVLLSSGTLSFDDGERRTFVVADGAADLLAPFVAIYMDDGDGSTTYLHDLGAQNAIQVINAAADGAARDIYLHDDFSAPVITALPSFGVSPWVFYDFAEDATTSVTLTGSTTVEADNEFDSPRARPITQLIAGAAGEISTFARLSDNRVWKDTARIRFMNGTSTVDALEVIVLLPEEEVSDSFFVALATAGISERSPLAAGEYQLALRDRESDQVVYGPVPLILTEGVYTALAVDGATPGTVDVVYMEDFE